MFATHLIEYSSTSSDGGGGSNETPSTVKTVSTLMFVLGVIASFVTPLSYSMVNLVDKVAISQRVKNTPSYMILVGLIDLAMATTLFLCARGWNDVIAVVRNGTWLMLLYPVLAGIFLASDTFFYYFALEGSDVSRVMGISNTYPMIVSFLCWIFLHESIGLWGYLGMAITTMGAVVLSLDVTEKLTRRVQLIYHRIRGTTPKLQDTAEDTDEEAPLETATETEAETETEGEKSDVEKGLAKHPAHHHHAGAKKEKNENIVKKKPALRFVDQSHAKKALAKKEYKDSGSEAVTSSDFYDTEDEIAAANRKKQQLHGATTTEPQSEGEGSSAPTEASGEKKKSFFAGKLVLLLLIPMVLCISGNEFMIKVSTGGSMSVFAITAITYGTFGCSFLLFAFSKKARKGFSWELRHTWYWGVLAEALTIFSMFCIVVAMNALPAAVVSSLQAIQPLYVLILEKIAGVSDDTCRQCITNKLLPISLIVGGVVVLSVTFEH